MGMVIYNGPGGYKYWGEGHKIIGSKKGEGHRITTLKMGEGHKIAAFNF